MADKVIKKKYYKIDFELASPLALGSGDNDNTDKDLIRDSKGKPYIPASSIAGVLREYLEESKPEEVKKYFGQAASQKQSLLTFYDAEIMPDKYTVSVRDSVSLDEFKTVKKGAKFDMEVLEPGVTFRTYIEQDYTDEAQDDFALEAVKYFKSAQPVFGGKGTRGYGSISDVKVWEKVFLLSDEKGVRDWLEFDLFADKTEWNSYSSKEENGSKTNRITLKLKQKGGISIRRYTTEVSTDEKIEPDMEQLTLHDGTPVIPGTSWAGAIGHRMSEFGINTQGKESIFGFAKGDGIFDKARSGIVFRESVLEGCREKILSRNSIDRFTGGTVDGALFTEKTFYNGTTDLVIEWKGLIFKEKGPEDDKISRKTVKNMPDKEKKALAAALTDLHFGFLAVGGETSIGRGLFKIESINEKPIPENKKDVYAVILGEIEEEF